MSMKSNMFLIENLLSDCSKSPDSSSSSSPCSSPIEFQATKRPKFCEDFMRDTPRQINSGYIYANPISLGNIVYAQPIPFNRLQPIPPPYYMRGGNYLYDVSGRRRKTRTVFTQEQTSRLEACFNSHKYLCLADRMSLARELNLNEAQIKTWFQNRRTKLKKQLADMDEDVFY